MMNSIKIFAGIIILCFLCNGCKKNDFDFDSERGKIVGSWSLKKNIEIIRGDTLFNEIENEVVLELNADGSGVEVDNFEYPIEWQYQSEPERISIIYIERLTSIDHRIFNILINNTHQQSWKHTRIINSEDRNITRWGMFPL